MGHNARRYVFVCFYNFFLHDTKIKKGRNFNLFTFFCNYFAFTIVYYTESCIFVGQ